MNKLNKGIIYAAAFMLSAVSLSSQATDDNICTPGGYTVGFFNGVWNSEQDARDSLHQLQSRYFGDTYNDQSLKYEVFYNHTEGMSDLIEVFIQRAAEMDGILLNRYELFWEALNSATQGDYSVTAQLLAGISDARTKAAMSDLIDAIVLAFRAEVVAGTAAMVLEPPKFLEQDYATHRTRLDALIVEKEKLVLVAHSQGNLFVNQAYDYALGKTTAEGIKVVHVAPASATLRSDDYILGDMDVVINGLRVAGSDSVVPSNVSIPLLHVLTDASGHTLVNTYMNKRLDTYRMLGNQFKAALDGVMVDQPSDNYGFFTVTMTWDGYGDVDLHTTEPDGNHVFFRNKMGTSGYLDVDNTHSYGPEHYYASCEPAKLQEGVYNIGLNNYARATGRLATLQVATSRDGEIFSQTLDVGPVVGVEPVIPVVNLKVEKDSNGNYEVALVP